MWKWDEGFVKQCPHRDLEISTSWRDLLVIIKSNSFKLISSFNK